MYKYIYKKGFKDKLRNMLTENYKISNAKTGIRFGFWRWIVPRLTEFLTHTASSW